MRSALLAILFAALCYTGVSGLAQVWVPQAPPFSAIAFLAGFPDLRAVWPVAGPPTTDIRVTEWRPDAPIGGAPMPFLRLLRVGGKVTGNFILWSFGPKEMFRGATSSPVHCVDPTMSSGACLQTFSLSAARDWSALVTSIATARECPKSAAVSTDSGRVVLQLYRREATLSPFREYPICEPDGGATIYRLLRVLAKNSANE